MSRLLVLVLMAVVASVAGCVFAETVVTVQNDTTSRLVIRITDSHSSRSWLVQPMLETTIARERIADGATIELVEPDTCEIVDRAEALGQSFAIIISARFPSTVLIVYAEDPPLKQVYVEPNFGGC